MDIGYWREAGQGWDLQLNPHHEVTYLTVFSFNSYTQQVCVDDAVVIDPDRINNAATNDDSTMQELCYGIGARAKAVRAADKNEYEDNDEEEEESKLESKKSHGTARELFKRGPKQIVSYSSRVVNNIRYLIAALILFFLFFLSLFFSLHLKCPFSEN